MKKVLIVDDDINISNILRKYFEKEAFEVYTKFNGEDAVDFLKQNAVDIIVLDIMLPGIDGIQTCREIKKIKDIPIIMLTAKGQVEDRIKGLKTGADDYMVKPFDPNELIVRVQAVLRRISGAQNIGNPDENKRVIKYESLIINLESFEILLDAKDINLPKREFELLEFLASNPNKVFGREHLIESIWGWDFEGGDRAVDLYVQRLRKRLKPKKDVNWSIKTIWGIGYKFEVNK